jgi:1-acyl-sn-glycerol-3-phosphate acyltransferase
VLLFIAKLFFLVPITLFFSIWALAAIPFDRSGKWFRRSPLLWSKIILWTFGIKIKVAGYENLDNSKSYVFVSNHASMFDIPTVMVALKGRVNIVFKEELTYVPVWGWALRFGHFIMIDRSNPRKALASIERAAETIRAGSSVILFPEGTRTQDGKLQPFKRGAFSLAAKAGVPVVPLTINGTFKIMPKGSFSVIPANISVIIGMPVYFKKMSGKDDELKLMEQAHREIEKNYINQA